MPRPLEPGRYLWVSTKGGGLNLLDKNTGKFQHFTSQNSGLPNDVVYGILPDDQGNLWMSTNRGLSRLTIDPEASGVDGRRSYRFHNFREYDGLQSDEFNTGSFARCPDSQRPGRGARLFFGGVNGLTAFYPSEIMDRQSDANACITALKINNLPVDIFQQNSPLSRPIHRTDQLRLHYDQNNVTLEFALMDFVTPQENRYRYRLHGADPDWVESGKSHNASYTRLSPGDYVFEVQGCIAGGKWSAPARLAITVLPPWWATWWAYAIYGCIIVGLILGIRKYEIGRVRAREEALRLKELESAKARLYTNITHEFRTPLTVIMGIAEQLAARSAQTAADSAEKKDMVGGFSLIRRNSKKLLHLINQMLDLSKLESGAMKLNVHQADIIRYLGYLTESFYSMAKEKDVRLVFYPEHPELVMDFDEEKLQHVVYNLLTNALKFTARGGKVILHARVLEASAAPRSLQFNVQDTGMGISSENLPHVFDRFYQVDDSHTRSNDGSGIGLALTKEFVELMGGSISVVSTLGEGSTFTFLLPIKNEAPFAAPEALEKTAGGQVMPEAERPVEGNTGAADLNSEKPLLLIVEDNKDVAAYIRGLVKNDYQVETAPDGKTGLEMALKRVPDIIISDVMMPEMDGYELTGALKTDERTSHIPIILLTAKATEEDRIAGLRTGADAYLVKPFNKAELMVRLEKLTELRRQLQQRYAALEIPPANVAPANLEDAFLQKLIQIVETQLEKPEFGADGLCQAVLMSRSQLYRKLMALTGKSPTLFIRSIRLRKAADLLRGTAMNVSEIAWATGFNDPNYFSRVFHVEFGKTPGELVGMITLALPPSLSHFFSNDCSVLSFDC